MSFDEQLKRAIDSLTVNLHDELSRRAQLIRDELAAAVEADRVHASAQAAQQQKHLADAVSEAVRTRQQLDEALADAQQRQQRLDGLSAEHMRQQQRVEELTAENVRYQQRFDDLTAENARQQNELEEAGAEAARLRLELEAAASKAAAVPPPATFVAAAITAGMTGAIDTATPTARDSATPERLVNAIREMDDARSLSDILDTLLTAASVEAGRAAVLLVRAGRYTGWRSLGFHPPVERGEIVELRADASVIPIDIGGETVAVLRTERIGNATSLADTGLPDPNLELLTRHAARCLESVTAFKAARAALVQPNGNQDSPDDATTDEDGSARRYAKLLVSEIKLYHGPEVLAGRRERDLTTRLGGEIARARVLYEQRVPAHIREQTDYFHDELVRTLGNGDSTLFHLS
jgi:hypothetical protein